MSTIQYHSEPQLRNPIIIAAFAGWNDAADAATTAVKFLIDKWKPTKVAEIDPEEFFIFTETRPTIKLSNGIQRSIVWPSSNFFAYELPEEERDILLYIGVEPQLKWKTFTNTFLEVCKHFNVSETILMGALLADVPHSITVPISGSSPDDGLKERLQEMDVLQSRYEGPTGIIGILQEANRRASIPVASLWASTPHYLAATPNIKVTAALLTYLNTFLSLGLDLNELQNDAVHFEEQITALVARDPEASAYVRKLEEQLREDDEDDDDNDNDNEEAEDEAPKINTGPLPSAEALIRGVEELLRQERHNGSPLDSDEDEE
ncbi:MAG TPA: PAC2 family protein [Ktedonobacteraceae bacterium]|nr:PAC2 family protein [Ktedonobacteraceae bacterium]